MVVGAHLGVDLRWLLAIIGARRRTLAAFGPKFARKSSEALAPLLGVADLGSGPLPGLARCPDGVRSRLAVPSYHDQLPRWSENGPRADWRLWIAREREADTATDCPPRFEPLCGQQSARPCSRYTLDQCSRFWPEWRDVFADATSVMKCVIKSFRDGYFVVAPCREPYSSDRCRRDGGGQRWVPQPHR